MGVICWVFFSTCQVRVLRCSKILSELFSFLLPPFGSSSPPQQQVPDRSGHYRTSTHSTQPHNITTNTQYTPHSHNAETQDTNTITTTHTTTNTITDTKSRTQKYKHTATTNSQQQTHNCRHGTTNTQPQARSKATKPTTMEYHGTCSSPWRKTRH